MAQVFKALGEPDLEPGNVDAAPLAARRRPPSRVQSLEIEGPSATAATGQRSPSDAMTPALGDTNPPDGYRRTSNT
jgi:hypothetical protein